MTQRIGYSVIGCFLASALVGFPAAAELSAKQALGKQIFFDTNLSEPAGQSCASCHSPSAGFADPNSQLPVSQGVIPGRFGTRNSPSAAYAAFFPTFSAKGNPSGGQFWDGRAADLVEQAKGPFLNPVEMNNPDRATVVEKLRAADYATLFRQVYGANALNEVDTAYDLMADAIADFERSSEVNPFSSKYDHFLAGRVRLTAQEERGRKLFSGAGKCSNCHTVKSSKSAPAMFTDFRFHNIGLPKNREYPLDLQPEDVRDLGLGAVLNDPKQNGKFKNPHLRNVALTAPYMHNGVLKTLKEVVHFYNTRDIPGMWPAPEVPETMDGNFMGNLGLSDADEDALVAFMMTLTDGYDLAQ
jgi:cytochrome c peroxidase